MIVPMSIPWLQFGQSEMIVVGMEVIITGVPQPQSLAG